MIPSSRWRTFRRLSLYLIWTLLCIPIHVILLRLPGQLKATFPRFYHRVCLRLFGIEVIVQGQKTEAHPALFVANHSSYLDISVLGSLIPGSFIAKSEVNTWPGFGLLARLQRTVFVERSRSSKVTHQRDEIRIRLAQGDALILFAEGTSSDGNRVLPFKSALFSAVMVDGADFIIQPVSITPVALDGFPLGWTWRHFYAWLGADNTLLQHLIFMAGLGRIKIIAEFHPPVTLHQFSHRKQLAQYCWGVVAEGVSKALAG